MTNNNKNKVKDASPIDLKIRIDELLAFQSMMDTFNKLKPRPEIVRTQIIVQNYICFVYLKDALFEALREIFSSDSLTKKCCNFLLNNPVRAFRNAIAHGNWKYNENCTGIEFWAHKGDLTKSKMTKWEVHQKELAFWQALSRMVAYVTFLTLAEN